MAMLIIPAIDILEGKVVRLKQGIMEDAKKYYDNPLDVAKMFEDLGAKRVHIVDLDGAKKGTTVNYNIIAKIVSNTKLEVEVGGGIRDFDKANGYLDLGVNFIIIGTAAVKNKEFTKELLKLHNNKVILGLDCKGEFIATDGWYKKSETTIYDIIDFYKDTNPHAIIYTDIERDGMLTGLNLEMLKKLTSYSNIPVIASGGVKGGEDIENLKAIPNIYGCIIGKAFYEGKIDLKKAFTLQN